MINEYLFLSDEHRATVQEYKPAGVAVEISDIENTTLWVAAFSLANRNEESARKLSEVHTIVMQYSPLVLSCESSEYYNRALFPLVNGFERKLRKLLYLAASISDNEKAKENIKQLEKKDFGEIFDLLFIDLDFIIRLKDRINAKNEFNGKSKYTKGEIKTYLDSIVEHTLWDAILGEKNVPTLKGHFREIQTYRNDVMHAHNISKELFGKARYLFAKVNNELDSAIGKQIENSEEKTTEQKLEVNTKISSALAAMDLFKVSDAIEEISESTSVFAKAVKGTQPPNLQSSFFAKAVKGTQPPNLQSSFFAKVVKGIQPPNLQSSFFAKAVKMKSIENNLIDGAMKNLQLLKQNNALNINNTLQNLFCTIAENSPYNLSLGDEYDDADEDEPETDNKKSEEENPDE